MKVYPLNSPDNEADDELRLMSVVDLTWRGRGAAV
jgi:hypothetical protein